MKVGTYHVGLSVRGALKNRRTQKELAGYITTEDGKKLTTTDEVQDWLLDQLAMGREMLPFGECDNWDWKEGCKGHEKATNQG